jgi:hypothetical protein
MPIARFELPDGRIGRFEVPDGTTPEQAMQLISSNLSSLIPKEEPAQQVEAPADPTANLTPAPPAVSTAAPTAGKPWWAPFAESATGEAELGKQFGPKVLGGPFVQDVAAALQNTPTYAKAAAQAVAGGNTPEDLTSQTDWRHDTIAEARNLSKQNAKDPALQEEYILGITRQKIQELPQNAMFSVISMGAGLAAGAAGLVAGPVGAYAAGTAASGLAAYRMDTNGFLRDIREHLDEGSIKATGKPLTDKQWLDYAKQYNSLVQEHGLWEAVPEALGNALGAKLGATIFKEAGKGLLGTLKSFGATALEFGNELGTETVTQTGQHNTEIDAGLSDQPKRSFVNPSDIAQSAKEVLPDVLLLSGMMAGGAHIAGKVYDNTNFGQNKQIADAIKENVKSGDFSPDKIRKEAIARLDPNSYNQELIQPAETVDRNKRLPAAIAPPEQPPEDTQQVEPRVEAAPSESQNTQAMLDELAGEAPAEKPKAEEPKTLDDHVNSFTNTVYDFGIKTEKDLKEMDPSEAKNNIKEAILDEIKEHGKLSKDTRSNLVEIGVDQKQIDNFDNAIKPFVPAAPQNTPKLPPKVEQVASFPMGENTEYHVLKTPTGYTANMFDKDAGKYVPGSAKMFPTKTFGGEAQTKAVDYVKEQAEKAAKFNPVEKPQEVVTPPEKTKTFPSHLSPEFQAVYENHLKSADAANKVKSMAKVGTATQAQAQPFIDRAEKARADMFEALFKERDNLSPENKETIDLAQRAIDAGQRGFAEGMLSNIIKNRPPTPQDMDFRRTRTAELETQAKPKENVPVKETHNLDTLFENQSLDKKRLDNLGTFDDRTKESIAKTNEYLQKLADAINAKGFRVFEGHASMPQDIKNLKDAFTNLHAGASRVLLDTQHVAGKEARKSKKSHGEQNVEIQAAQKKLNKSHIEQNKDIEKARDLLGEIKRKEPKSAFKRDELQGTPAPLPEEISAAEETVRLNKQDINKAKRASYSLWTALKGTLTAGNVADLGNEYRMLKAGKGKQGTDISSLVHSKALDPFLPFKMRRDSDTYDELDAVEEIKSRLMAKNYLTYEAEMEIEQLMGSTQDAEAQIREYLTLKEVNELIDQAADEQREADLDARTLESEREEGAIGAGENELALTGQTPEEVRAAERAKEDRLKADKEAEAKAKADEGVEDFTLTGSNRPADIAAAQGQEGLFDQPKVEEKPAEMEALNDKIHEVVEQKSQEFQPGDHASLGSVPGVVLGVEGDYVKFKPDNAPNPKAYQRVPAKTLTFNFRPGAEPKVAASKASDQQTGTEKGKLNADMGGLIKLLGANMYAANIADVSVKELLQNAFDASKAAVKLGLVNVGKIDIVVNDKERTITVTDNARGMTPSIVKDAFFTVAGSDKSDLDPKERSGGLGLAKMGFMLGSERLKLDTVRDGIRTIVDTDSQAIADSKFDIKKTKAPQTEHGTSVTVKIPEKYTDPKTGDQKDIWFPYNKDSIDTLKQPLVGPVEVTVDFDGNKETLPIGVNFDDKKMPKLTTVHFSWGDADVYFGVDRKESTGYRNRPSHKVLSSGVYQFRHDFALNQSEIIPYDILVNVKPDVEAKHPDYPFENSRERFKGRIEADIKSLGQYLQQVAMGNEAKDLQENFKGIVSMPRLEVGSEIADASKKLKKAFDTRNVGNEKKFELPPVPREIFVSDGFVKTKAGEDLVKPTDNKKESTFTSEKEAPKMADFMVNMKQDPKLPIFHNNTNVDYLEVGRPYGDPEKFFAEMGTLLVEMKEELANSGIYKYDMLKPENLFFGGISIDKKYGGVHIKVPYKGVFVNPFYDFGAKTLAGVRETILNTMIHEIAHTGSMSHGVEHNGQMIKVANYLADASMMDYYRDAIMDILVRNESAFTAMREAYGKSTTQNTSKSFEDYDKSAASKAPGTTQGVGVNQSSTVPTGGKQRSLFPLSGAGQTGGQGQVNQGGGGAPIGQQGNMFPPGPPSKRNVFGGPAPKNSWELAPETKLGHLINTLDYKIHDKHVDTRQVQAAITKNAGLIDDTFDAYMKEELYHSRTANEIKDFLKKDLSPIIGDLIKDRLNIDDLEQYLHNRHAEERNDAIAQINPRFADVDNEPGSGIGTKAARDYFKNLDPTKAAQLAKIAAKVDDIIKGTQKILVDRGLETQQTIDNWNGAYKHYIPLMRDQEELDFMHNGAGLGKGFQVKGSASKRAYGSTKSVVDILANIAIQRESAVIRSEKARIGRALYGLALKNPNPDFWLPVNPDAVKNKAALYQELIAMGLPISVAQNFIQEPKTPSIDPLTGQVRYTINAGLRSSPNVFPVRINGKDRYIFFNTKDPKAIRMAQAMSNLDAQTLGGLLGTTALITRWIASVNTQYNPVFGVVNFYRDTKGAMLNMTNTPLAGMQKEVLSHVFPAMFAIIQNERASRNNKTVTNPYSVLYDRFRRAGGTTGFREAFAKGNFSGKDTTIIERLWKEETQGAAMKKARYIFDALSDYNEAMENAVRLSIFKVALDHNLSEERAASLGKNITINFNRKGQSTPLFQALYAFFNPAVQGTVLVGKTLAGPAGRKIVAGGLAIGVLQALWMAAAGFDADEPPDYVRDKNFIIPIGNKKYLTLPMPPGYNVIPGLSRIITEYVLGQNHLISGGKPLTDAAAQILTLFVDSFNPLGGGSLLQMVSPTVIDPIAATAMNKDAFGRPIFKEDLSTKPTPGFMRSRENATQVSQWIAEFLNYVSSPAGTHYTKGKWSPTADEIDYYAGQVGGGAAREAIKAAELAKSAFTSEPVPSYRIPFAGRFYGDAKSQSAIQDKFYNNITLMNKYGNEITNIQKSGQDPSKYMRAHPEAQLYNAASNFNNAINEMNKNKKNMLKNKLPLKDIREYEAQKYQIMKTFNDQVASAQKQR